MRKERGFAAELHKGTVTFLFTDIEGSTRLLIRLGDRYGAVLGEHRRILREAAEAREGREIDAEGDGFFFAFGRANAALEAVVVAQRALAEHAWPEGGEVRVRMGLHTGEPVMRPLNAVELPDALLAAHANHLVTAIQRLLDHVLPKLPRGPDDAHPSLFLQAPKLACIPGTTRERDAGVNEAQQGRPQSSGVSEGLPAFGSSFTVLRTDMKL